jgi:hypothetical protein
MAPGELRDLVGNNKIFTVEFVKKDGTLRKMNARLGVRKGVKGVGMSWDPFERGMIPVFDMQKKEFRMINTRTMRTIKYKGTTYEIEHL